MAASPVHQNRIRRRFLDAGETPPPLSEEVLAQRALAAATRDERATHPGPDTQGGSEAVTKAVATWENVLRELPPLPGQAEHAALVQAMEDTAPACDGLETFTRDKFVDPEEVEIMRGICRNCPLLELCAAFATVGRPTSGMWAGCIPSERLARPSD